MALDRSVFLEIVKDAYSAYYTIFPAEEGECELPLAFRAEYLSGTAVPDGTELDSLGWFRPDDLPPLPRQGSVAAAVIGDWCASLRS